MIFYYSITNILRDLRLEFTKGTSLGKRILETLSDHNATMGLTNTELCFRLIDKNEDGILERSEIINIIKWFLAAAMYHPIASQYLKGIDITSPEADEAIKLVSDDLFCHAGDMLNDQGVHIKAITFVGFRTWLTEFMMQMMINNNEDTHDEHGNPKLQFDSIAIPHHNQPQESSINQTDGAESYDTTSTSISSSVLPEQDQTNTTVEGDTNIPPTTAITSEEIVTNPLPESSNAASSSDTVVEEEPSITNEPEPSAPTSA